MLSNVLVFVFYVEINVKYIKVMTVSLLYLYFLSPLWSEKYQGSVWLWHADGHGVVVPKWWSFVVRGDTHHHIRPRCHLWEQQHLLFSGRTALWSQLFCVCQGCGMDMQQHRVLQRKAGHWWVMTHRVNNAACVLKCMCYKDNKIVSNT